MAGIGRFTVEISGERQVDLGISRMIAAVQDMRPFWPAFQDAFFRAEQDQFSSQGGAGRRGAWVHLSPAYAAWKASVVGSKPILQFSGKMVQSLTGSGGQTIYEAEPQTLVLGSAVPYAAYHQTGTETMPQRRPIDISTAQESQYFGRAIGYMARDLGYMWSGGSIGTVRG